MRYLVDTDWIIEYLKGNEKIVNILQKSFHEGLAISVISLAELYEGVYISKDPEKHSKALDDFTSGVEVLNITNEICKQFGKLRSKLKRKGELIDNFDLLIASTALSHNLIILTNNIEHFNRTGVEVLSEKDF